MNNKKKKLLIKPYLFIDFLIIILSFYIALFLRFDGNIPTFFINNFKKYILAIVLIKVVVFYLFNFYRIYWKVASIEELVNLAFGVFTPNFIIFLYVLANRKFPLSVIGISAILDFLLIGFTRFVLRYRSDKSKSCDSVNSIENNIMIVGAGEAGILLLDEYRKHPNLGQVTSFIDDDEEKKGQYIKGIQVDGSINEIPHIVNKKKIDEIILAIPSLDDEDRKYILDTCTKTNKKVKVLPGIYEIIDGKFDVSKIRDVEIEDLLGRDSIKLDQSSLAGMIEDRTILVTGGGGSIGSELCRQISKYKPKKLVILDIYENNAYSIQMELERKYGKNLDLEVVIESIRDRERMEYIFNLYRPDIVFHAAAHKHVPLMEDSYISAIKNNVFGTKNLLEISDKYQVKKFVNISTDKAVNPTNIMGATKRIIEIMLQTINSHSATDYVAVRFGNVLGSNGSVIPLFKKQINDGGPVTVTHPDIIRYFMTIPEACQLVLQAGAIAKGGEIFILDMGEPVKILDLAENLISLSGLVPYKDIDIVFTGLRPGEKLYEELLLNLENSDKTSFEKIYIEKPEEHNTEELEKNLENLRQLGNSDASKDEIIKAIEKIVPTFSHKENR